MSSLDANADLAFELQQAAVRAILEYYDAPATDEVIALILAVVSHMDAVSDGSNATQTGNESLE